MNLRFPLYRYSAVTWTVVLEGFGNIWLDVLRGGASAAVGPGLYKQYVLRSRVVVVKNLRNFNSF